MNASDLHRLSTVVDTVNRSRLDDQFLEDIRDGGISVLGRTILVSSGDVFSPFGFEESLRDIVQTRQFVDVHSDRLMMVERAEDIAAAQRTGRTGLYIYFQSPEPIGRSLWRLRLFHLLGLRVLQLTYNERSLAGDGCAEPNDGGLSEFGGTLVAECNRLGIAIDVSHCGEQTGREAIERSTTPVLLTHANSRTLCDNRRCKSDEHVKACAAKGGVVGAQALPAFVSASEPNLAKMLDHVEHYLDLVGENHVGLGLDLTNGHEHDDYSLLGYKPEMYQGVWLNGVQQPLPGIESLADVPRITEGLLARAIPESTVAKVLGGNFARVLSEIWSSVDTPAGTVA